MLVLVPEPSDFPVKLRAAREADIESMAAVESAAYWCNFNQLEPGSHDHPNYYEKVIAGGQANALSDWPAATIAELNVRVVGVCYLEFNPALLSGLWVLPEMHGKGIGGLLIADALERFKMRGELSVTIEVHPRNPAVHLYERCGFKLAEVTTRYSKGLERDLPLWVMQRWL